MSSFNNRVVVTGGAGDIGRAICREFLEKGFFVFIVDVRQEALLSFSQELTSMEITSSSFKMICADITQEDEVNKKVITVLKPSIDIFVHCVGFSHADSFKKLDFDCWQKDIELNLNSSYLSVKPILKIMKAQKKGAIVLIGSVNADRAYGSPAYSASKAGLISLVKSIAMEYGSYGIRANVVSPGSVSTRAWKKRVEKNPNVFEELKKWYPLARITTPEGVAKAVCFLASEEASCISGINLRVDCGLSAGNFPFAKELTQEEFD